MGFLNDGGWGTEGYGMGKTNAFSVAADTPQIEAGDLGKATEVAPSSGGSPMSYVGAANTGLNMLNTASGDTAERPTVMGGVASGAMAGGSIGGPWGAVIGGVLGGASSLLGSSAYDKNKAGAIADQGIKQMMNDGSSARARSAQGALV